MQWTLPEGLKCPPDPWDPIAYRKIKEYALEAIADLLTDPRWAREYWDDQRTRVYEDFLAFDRLPDRTEFADRIAMALQELRIRDEAYQYLTDRWFRRRTFLRGEPGYVYR